jgi:hypothetical protein
MSRLISNELLQHMCDLCNKSKPSSPSWHELLTQVYLWTNYLCISHLNTLVHLGCHSITKTKQGPFSPPLHGANCLWYNVCNNIYSAKTTLTVLWDDALTLTLIITFSKCTSCVWNYIILYILLSYPCLSKPKHIPIIRAKSLTLGHFTELIR